MSQLPTVSEINAAKGSDLRNMHKSIFGQKSSEKDDKVLRKKMIEHLKTVAKAKDSKKPAASAAYDQNLKAAEDAEAKGEWLTAAMAWESAAKLTVGKSAEQCLDRAAKARINAKAPKAGGGGKSAEAKAEEKKAREAKAEEAKKAREAEAARIKSEREARAQALKTERDGKKAAKLAEKEAAKKAREEERAKKKAEKEAAKVKTFIHDERVAHLVGQTITHRMPRSGETFEIKVLPDGFQYLGEHYKSLSAIGKRITGKSCNGFVYFGLVAAPRPELKEENIKKIVEDYATARKGNSDLPQSLEKVLDGDAEGAHAAAGAITSAIEDLEGKAKALRLAKRLIEAKKGKASANGAAA